jgi:hypothetical protein
VGDIHDGHGADVLVDAVDDSIGPATRAVPVLQRGTELLADPMRVCEERPMMNSYAAAAAATDSGRFSVSWRQAVGVIART